MITTRSTGPTTGLPRLLREVSPYASHVVMGHSRLITNGLSDNQPVVYEDVCVLHNGIIVNHEAVWEQIDKPRKLEIDSEVIAAIAPTTWRAATTSRSCPARVLDLCRGVVACAVALPRLGQAVPVLQQRKPLRGDQGRRDVLQFGAVSPGIRRLRATSSRSATALFIDIPRPRPTSWSPIASSARSTSSPGS